MVDGPEVGFLLVVSLFAVTFVSHTLALALTWRVRRIEVWIALLTSILNALYQLHRFLDMPPASRTGLDDFWMYVSLLFAPHAISGVASLLSANGKQDRGTPRPPPQ